MHIQSLPISKHSLPPTNFSPTSTTHILTSSCSQTSQIKILDFHSKLKSGFCNSAKRVSKSPINRAKGGVFVSLRCEGSQEEEDDGFYTRRCVKGFILKLASLMLRFLPSGMLGIWLRMAQHM